LEGPCISVQIRPSLPSKGLAFPLSHSIPFSLFSSFLLCPSLLLSPVRPHFSPVTGKSFDLLQHFTCGPPGRQSNRPTCKYQAVRWPSLFLDLTLIHDEGTTFSSVDEVNSQPNADICRYMQKITMLLRDRQRDMHAANEGEQMWNRKTNHHFILRQRLHVIQTTQ